MNEFSRIWDDIWDSMNLEIDTVDGRNPKQPPGMVKTL